MRSLLPVLSCVLLLIGCKDPFADSNAAFDYQVVRSNGEELTVTGPDAFWDLTTLTTFTGTQTVFTLELRGFGAGDDLLPNPTLQIETQSDDLAQAKPATGSYQLVLTGDQYFRVRIGTLDGGNTFQGYLADAGTVTITGSSKTTVNGRLNLHFKEDFQNPDTANFEVTGEFTAKRSN